MCTLAIAATVVAAAAAIVGTAISASSASSQAKYQEEQYNLQQKQLLTDYQNTLNNLKNNQLSADKMLSDYQESQAMNKLSILQTEANMGSYETLLDRWQGDYNYQMNTLQTEGQGQFESLLNNWSSQEVINAETGRSGKTAEILENQQKNKLINYVGSDLKLNDTGGLYGQARRELNLDLMADKASYEGQLGILSKTLNQYNENASIYEQNINDLSESLSDYNEKIMQYEDLIQQQQKVIENL